MLHAYIVSMCLYEASINVTSAFYLLISAYDDCVFTDEICHIWSYYMYIDIVN